MLFPLATLAQRVDENAVTAADDAFGTTVGSQAIGLYDAEDVRGFSPKEAGNLRIEGLYFDQQTFSANNCLVGEQSIKVGLTAQAYDFPSPTGIANYSLRDAAPGSLASVVMSRGPFDAASVEVDGHYGKQGSSLSADGCFHRALNSDFDFSRYMQGNDAGLVLRAQLPGNLEVIAFGGISKGDEHNQLPFVYTEGALGVPAFRQMRLPTQDWTHWTWDDRTYGAILRSTGNGPWSLAAGVFRSEVGNPLNYNDLFLDVAPDRTALHVIDVLPPLHASSTSGEVRASYRATSGARVDQWAVMVRGRAVDRAFGGDSVTDLGRVSIDDFSPLPQPPVVFTATSDDRVRQFGLGIEYDARWPEHGSVGLGLQHVDYNRSIDAPGSPTATDRATPLLPAFRFTINPARQYLIYGSYTRGLEDSQLAPASAVNRGESPPATSTWQIDAGLRYSPGPGTQLLLGAFEVHKGYFSLDSSDVYTQLGQIRHRGIETSVTLDGSQGLVAVLGGVWLQAKLLNTASDAASPGNTPLGTVPLQLNADLDYAPAWLKPWGLSCGWQGVSSRPATNDGSMRLPAYSVLSFTVRYAFALFGHSAVARFDAQNVGNANGLMVDDSGTVLSERERGFMLTLTADF